MAPVLQSECRGCPSSKTERREARAGSLISFDRKHWLECLGAVGRPLEFHSWRSISRQTRCDEAVSLSVEAKGHRRRQGQARSRRSTTRSLAQRERERERCRLALVVFLQESAVSQSGDGVKWEPKRDCNATQLNATQQQQVWRGLKGQRVSVKTSNNQEGRKKKKKKNQ